VKVGVEIFHKHKYELCTNIFHMSAVTTMAVVLKFEVLCDKFDVARI